MAKKIINVVYTVDDKALLKAKSNIQGIEKETKDSEKEMLKLDKAIQKVGNDGGKSFLNFKNILGAISVTALVAGLTQIGRKIFDLGVKQEQLNIAFTTFLGSAQKAKVLLADLTKFAIVTPFTPDQVNNAAKALLAFGVQGKEIIPTLKMLGDVSSGTGKDLTEMAIIFGQIRSTGRLMGQDLLQLINAGFNPLQIISEKTGKSVAKLKQEMEKGNISFQMVSDAFKTATSEGGLFFNLMEKQSQSIGGLMSTIEGNIEEGLKNIFTTSKGPLKDFVDQLVTLSEAFMEFTKSKEQLADENELATITETIDVYDKLNKAYGDSKKALDLTTEAIEKRKKAIEEEQATLLKVVNAEVPFRGDDIATKARKQAASERVALLNDEYIVLQTKVIPALEEHIVAEDLSAKSTKKSGDETKLSNKQLEQRAKALAEINRQIRRATGGQTRKEDEEEDEKRSKAKSDQITRELKQDADRAEVLKANNKDMEDERVRQAEEAADERIRIAEEEAKRKADFERAFRDFAIDSLQQILYSSLLTREEDFTSQQEKFDKELELAGDNEAAKDQIRARQENEEKLFRQRQKEAEKQNAIKRIAIDTAINVIRSIANNGGIPLGLPYGALAAAAGALQIATVRKFKKGEVAIDGPGTGTSDSIPAMISRGESVINADATSKSQNLLQAINDRKIDDRVLQNLAASGGRQSTVFDDSGIIKAIERNSVDYENHGYTLMKVHGKQTNFKRVIRSKVQGY